MTTQKHSVYVQLIPVMLAFFAMSFVDSIGTATNYVKESFSLSSTVANLCPMMVFVWFLVCSVPTGMLMNKIGRRKTVLVSLLLSVAACILPLLHYSFAMMLLVFALLGIGNALMQVSLNPLVSNIVGQEKMASFMTFGQFVKAICSVLAPILAAWFSVKYHQWTLLYAVFALEGTIALIWLWRENIAEETPVQQSGWKDSFALLKDPIILVFFIGMMCHVGIDVGINTTAPQILIERLDWPLSKAVYGSSIYFMFRMTGCLAGTFLLSKFSPRKVFMSSICLMAAAFVGLFFLRTQWPLYICFALIGLGNANIFPVIFSGALLQQPKWQNEVSGLMIMGLVGGMVFPFMMGILTDLFHSQQGAVVVLCLCVSYLFYVHSKINTAAQA